MDIAPLKIPLIRQEPDSDDCLRACALMVFRYLKDPITKEEVWKNLHVYKKHSGLRGGFPMDLGKLVMNMGHKCRVSHYDWQWWNKDAHEASKENKKQLVSSLTKLKEKQRDWPLKKVFDKEIGFVRGGGRIIMQRPKLERIDEILVKRLPVILFVTTSDFYHNPNVKQLHDNHSILVIGKKREKYLLRDPLLAVEKMHKDDLLFSWIRAGGWMMTIVPGDKKKELPVEKIKQQKLRL